MKFFMDSKHSPEHERHQEYEYVHEFSDVKPTRFRFKTKRSASIDEDTDEHRSKRRRRHHHHGRHSRRSRHDDTSQDASREQSSDPTRGMDPETAFRESLFDAMADDEGADYWQGIYGQPVHIYSKSRPVNPDDPNGEIEQMTDEEYTAHVRARMWEKTHQHVLEERRLRDEAAKKRNNAKKQAEYMETEKEAFNRQMEESLRKGARRRREKEWIDAWARYTRQWEKLTAYSTGRIRDEEVKNVDRVEVSIPWPTRSGQQSDVEREEVEAFFWHAGDKSAVESGLRSLLKGERVRWHPDRMSHALRGEIDTRTLQAVTAVFQIVDAQYNSVR